MINTVVIARLMHLTPEFYGVMGCNRLEQFRGVEKASFILNTDPDDKPGKHWVGVYIEDGTLFFFDSFGRGIQHFADPFRTILQNFAKGYNVITDSRNLQCIFNDSCGYWVVYYILCKTCALYGFRHFVANTFINEGMLHAQLMYLNLI